MKIYDFDEFEVGVKKYIGSETKYPIIINNEYYMLKEPSFFKVDPNMDPLISYNCISEFLGSHMYEILGIETHETILGYRTCLDGVKRLCVACKDFNDVGNNKNFIMEHFDEFLHDYRRNAEVYGYNKIAKNTDKERKMPIISEIEDVFNYDKSLINNPDAVEGFYIQFVVDALIANRDRHNYNWGFMVPLKPLDEIKGRVKFAPVFDNGSSLFPERGDNRLSEYCKDLRELDNSAKNSPSSRIREIDETVSSGYSSIVYYKYISSFKNERVNKALLKMAPIIESKLVEINAFIDKMVETNMISSVRGELYKRIIDSRNRVIIQENYKKLVKKLSNEEN